MYVHVRIPYSWKFSRDKTLKFLQILTYPRKCKPQNSVLLSVKELVYLINLFVKSWKEAIIKIFVPQKFPAIQ